MFLHLTSRTRFSEIPGKTCLLCERHCMQAELYTLGLRQHRAGLAYSQRDLRTIEKKGFHCTVDPAKLLKKLSESDADDYCSGTCEGDISGQEHGSCHGWSRQRQRRSEPPRLRSRGHAAGCKNLKAHTTARACALQAWPLRHSLSPCGCSSSRFLLTRIISWPRAVGYKVVCICLNQA